MTKKKILKIAKEQGLIKALDTLEVEGLVKAYDLEQRCLDEAKSGDTELINNIQEALKEGSKTGYYIFGLSFYTLDHPLAINDLDDLQLLLDLLGETL